MAQLGVLVTNVRRNLQELAANPANLTFYSSDNIKYFIGEAYRNYSLMMIAQGEGYFETAQNLPLVASVNEVDLSILVPEFFKPSVIRKNRVDGKFPLRSSEKRFTPTDIYGGFGSYFDGFTYRFRGRQTLVLDPAPNANEAASDTSGIEVEYVYLPDFPTASSLDTFEFDSNFSTIYEPMIELYATIAMFDAKEGAGALNDPATFRARLLALENQFKENLAITEDPDHVAYVGGYYEGYGYNNF